MDFHIEEVIQAFESKTIEISGMYFNCLTESDMILISDTLGYKLPQAFKEIYTILGRPYIYGERNTLGFQNPHHLISFNKGEDSDEFLRDFFLFGNDGGDYWYIADHNNLLNRGEWAIFIIEMGSTPGVNEEAEYVAPDISSLIHKICNGIELGMSE